MARPKPTSPVYLGNAGIREVGTPYYLSPETCSMGIHSKASDLWAMGCAPCRWREHGEKMWKDLSLFSYLVCSLFFEIPFGKLTVCYGKWP